MMRSCSHSLPCTTNKKEDKAESFHLIHYLHEVTFAIHDLYTSYKSFQKREEGCTQNTPHSLTQQVAIKHELILHLSHLAFVISIHEYF